ncbi:MAG: hypothetical protein AAFY71_18360 [Bacteroidota bacterium]
MKRGSLFSLWDSETKPPLDWGQKALAVPRSQPRKIHAVAPLQNFRIEADFFDNNEPIVLTFGPVLSPQPEAMEEEEVLPTNEVLAPVMTEDVQQVGEHDHDSETVAFENLPEETQEEGSLFSAIVEEPIQDPLQETEESNQEEAIVSSLDQEIQDNDLPELSPTTDESFESQDAEEIHSPPTDEMMTEEAGPVEEKHSTPEEGSEASAKDVSTESVWEIPQEMEENEVEVEGVTEEEQLESSEEEAFEEVESTPEEEGENLPENSEESEEVDVEREEEQTIEDTSEHSEENTEENIEPEEKPEDEPQMN